MRPLIIIGAANLEVAKLVRAINRAKKTWDVVGYVDDAEETWGGDLDGVPVIGPIDEVRAELHAGCGLINSIGTPAARRRISRDLRAVNDRFVTLTHPGVDTWGVEIGAGSIIHEGSSISGGASIGSHVILSYRVVVAHDVSVGDYSNVTPGAILNGRCRVGEGAYIGAGATLLPDVSVGEGATVGAGSVVTRAVAPQTTVFGVPARVISTPGGGA